MEGLAERVQVGAGATAGEATVKVRALEVAVQVSLRVIVKLYVPAVVGVPDKSPVAPSVTPAGKAPAVTDQVYVLLPPVP